MKAPITLPLALAAGLFLLVHPSPTLAQDRAERAIEKNDTDGDGRVSRDEWKKDKDRFDQMDLDKDGFLTIDEFRARFAGGERESGGRKGGRKKSGEGGEKGGPTGEGAGEKSGRKVGGPRLDGQVSRDAIDGETRCGITRSKKCDIKIAIGRGLFETGLTPQFPEGLACRGIDEGWAIPYTEKRDRENYHGGIDMPAPYGTPMIAAAAGTVVATSNHKDSFRGIEIIVRHSPEETGLPVWTYTQYAHFDETPQLAVGDRVRMGQALGPTGNSGRTRDETGRMDKVRRPAIHFAVWFSQSPNFANLRDKIVPVDGWWMDPNAFYRKAPPFDSAALKALPAPEKKVAIPVMLEDGTTVPAGAKVVWPYTCQRGG